MTTMLKLKCQTLEVEWDQEHYQDKDVLVSNDYVANDDKIPNNNGFKFPKNNGSTFLHYIIVWSVEVMIKIGEFFMIRELSQKGWTTATSKETGFDPKTIRKYINSDE